MLLSRFTTQVLSTWYSKNGVVDVTLSVRMRTTLNGTRKSPIYNRGLVCPTIRIKCVETLTVTLNNECATDNESYTRELMQYINDPQNEIDNLVNVTIIYNHFK
jgi:FtsP/CotA-like multicopper oxidase with cupredoxin domain